MMWKIQQAMPNNAIWTARIHAAVITVTGVISVHVATFPAHLLPRSQLEKLRSREQNQPALSYEHIFTKDLEYVEISETRLI